MIRAVTAPFRVSFAGRPSVLSETVASPVGARIGLRERWGLPVALHSNQQQTARPSGFGKRGIVTPPHPVRPQAQAADGSRNDTLKWIGGGLAVAAVLGIVGVGSGGGGLIGSLIGGLLGQKMAQNMNRAPTTAHAPDAHAPAAAATSVQRGGFGSTASASGVHSSGS